MQLDKLFEAQGGRAASQAYWNALKTLRAAWSEVFGEDLPTQGNLAKDAFAQAIDQVKRRLANDAGAERRFRAELDVDAKDDIEAALLGYADVDDLPPKTVKAVMYAECMKLGEGKHDLRSLLRPVLDQVFTDPDTRRPRVGPNRHWPRLLQYLRELEEETDWSPDGRGLKLMNAGGGGRVAAAPRDPSSLCVRIDPDFL